MFDGNMYALGILMVLGIVIMILGTSIGISYFRKRKYKDAVAVLFFPMLLGFAIFVPALYVECRDLTYTYEQPTIVLKTNMVVNVVYVDKDRIHSFRYDTIEAWISTNIVIRKKFGRNIYNYPIKQHHIDVVIK